MAEINRKVISIHAPVWGATHHSSPSTHSRLDFNPRAPCGARRRAASPRSCRSYFNPHAPCGARQRRRPLNMRRPYFNPHAPCGARRILIRIYADNSIFQSTRPVWGATTQGREPTATFDISIHTPRVGRDRGVLCSPIRLWNFNPHAPCGARPLPLKALQWIDTFQSTRPVWGATRAFPRADQRRFISIHTPRVGRDRACGHSRSCARDFNPRAPRGARRNKRRHLAVFRKFQSTRPAWGATTEP